MRARKLVLSITIIVTLVLTVPALAQRGNDEPRISPNAAVSQTIGVTVISVEYGRPGVKNRTIWGELVPYGEVWRAGANEATTISFSQDVTIEGNALAAGTYGLFMLPGEGEWTVIFNNVAKQWGAFNYDASQDALRVKVTPVAAEHQEWMSFTFENLADDSGNLVLRWEKLAVPVRIGVTLPEPSSE